MHRVRVVAPRRPTEDVERIRDALRNLFPDAALEEREDAVVGTTESLDHLRELIRNQKIRDTARKQLLAGRRGNTTRFALSKQAALMGRVNFSASSPLGDLEVEIESDDLEGTIDHVAESTVEGKG